MAFYLEVHFDFQASQFVRDDAVSNLIQLISDTDTLYTYTVQQLFRAIQDDRTQVGLLGVQPKRFW